MAAKKRPWRLNSFFGKIVPCLLLVYLVLVYRLIIVDYAYSRLVKSQGQQSRGFAFTSVIHALFLPALWAYLRVFFASPRLVKQPGEETFRDFLLEGAPLYQPPLEPPIEIKEKRILFECDAQGEPMRCFRDECQGRWKPARSRHCGDCRQCRLALDHHCPWFDADVMAPQTLLPFLLFLALIPPLLSIAFAPLLLPSYHSVRFMWKHANKSDYVNLVWWSRKRSWVGGPMYRWMIGFWLGSRECCQDVDDYFEHPNLYLPVLLLLAMGLVLVAFALLLSTLQQIAKGDLTIDARVRKFLMRRKKTKAGEQRGDRHFWIPLTDHKGNGVVITCGIEEQIYDLGGWRENLRAFLCLPPYTFEQLQLQWPISAATNIAFLNRARIQAQKDD